MSAQVLRAEGLTLDYRLGNGWVNAVRDVSLRVAVGEIHGLVGESGSGKSTVALALMGYLAPNARVSAGRAVVDGVDLLALPEAERRRHWGTTVSLVPQDALAALNPGYTVGEQIAEVLRAHQGLKRVAAWERAVAMLDQVRIADPVATARQYPHQLSGGMQQRVMIAMALIARPRLLILDEPTTALDVTTQATIIALIRDLVRAEGAAAVYVSHDLALVAQLCDHITVLYGGEVMESGSASQIDRAAHHPYTISLIASLPRLERDPGSRLPAIPGSAPALASRPAGCVFADRCPAAVEQCHREKPPADTLADGRQVKCWRWPEIADGTLEVARRAPGEHVPPSPGGPLLEGRDLTKRFLRGGWRWPLRRSPTVGVRALNRVAVHMAEGETLGVVGESGSGKTTLARVIVGLEMADRGELELLGVPLAPLVSRRPQAIRQQLQMIFQNPADALNPYVSVGDALARTVRRFELGLTAEAVRQRVDDLLGAVRLTPDYAQRYPAELSGGERQRIGIARAFAAHPALILADEPTSALDVSVQAAVLNLLKDLRAERRTAYLFISHDLRAVSYLADRIIVMFRGEIVEEATPAQFAAAPFHPYTELLLAALPGPDAPPALVEPRDVNGVDDPGPASHGCPFAGRCPRQIGPICESEPPPWQATPTGHHIRCHIPLAKLTALQSPPGTAS